ncbi:hypothetical protein MSI_26420 [Treponema sp. JC4]|uniref:hypothetical protein n=1 Tax=Treponema sp. JC4 TaxID=1124982 RepID=UPI00025B0B2C|nr:hypothetical protein [Treponema sp. JC4]EID83948.1 hypothetical protein MSI_26420 [Treponema sp. JC4]
MENKVTSYNNDNYENDLVDWFAILLRNRKLIIIGTFVLTFLAGLYIFIRPLISPKYDKKVLSVTYVIKTQGFPSTINYGLTRLAANLSLNDELANSFDDYPLLAKEYKKYPVFGENYPEDSLEYNDMIVKIFGYRKEDAHRNEKIHLGKIESGICRINCRIPEENYETHILDSFISEHLTAINKRFQQRAEEYLVILENKTLESYKEIKNANSSYNTTTIGRADTEQSLRETLQDIQFYKENPVTFYEIQEDPFVIPEESKSKLKSLIRFFFGSFALFICLAFVKYLISKIKNNKEIMKKITLAWNEGK